MAKPILYKKAEMTFVPYGGPPGSATMARLVGPEISRTMGGTSHLRRMLDRVDGAL